MTNAQMIIDLYQHAPAFIVLGFSFMLAVPVLVAGLFAVGFWQQHRAKGAFNRTMRRRLSRTLRV